MSAPSDEILLGKLALTAGLVSREQLDACVKEQEATRRPLGEVLVKRGILSQVDLQTLLAQQELNLQKRHETTLLRKQDSLFGRVAIILRMVSQEAANGAIREQARLETEGHRVRLGKVMVQRGLLTLEQVVQILDYQKKQVLFCEKCDALFNAPKAAAGKSIACRYCGASLVIPQRVTHCEVEELFQATDETQISPGTGPAGQPTTRPDETTDVSNAGSTRETLPPPPDHIIEHDDWFVVRDGKPAGPFEYRALASMAEQGGLTPASFVWRPEMDSWKTAGDVPEVAAVFTTPASETAIVAPPAPTMPAGVATPEIEGYHITGYLGMGGLGHVFRAKQVAMDREVAIKTLERDFMEDEDFVQKLVRDSRASARVTHPGIVQWIDMRQAGGTWHFISEFVEGPRVSELITGGATMTEVRALQVCRAVAAALDAAHRQSVLHRDVRPANIKLTADGQAKLCDLGLTRRPEHPQDGALGTPPWVAPETRTAMRLDTRSEVCALGLTLFSMLTGAEPPDSPGLDPRLWHPPISDSTAALVKRMTAREPEARPATAGDVAKEIDGILAKGMSTPPATRPAPYAPAQGWPGPMAAPAPQAAQKKPLPGGLRKRFRRK
ncbi:MAG: protein kinase [Planctomycetes bacterium]|nr:protein kinase [Planctomycetota bacterium]